MKIHLGTRTKAKPFRLAGVSHDASEEAVAIYGVPAGDVRSTWAHPATSITLTRDEALIVAKAITEAFGVAATETIEKVPASRSRA